MTRLGSIWDEIFQPSQDHFRTRGVASFYERIKEPSGRGTRLKRLTIYGTHVGQPYSAAWSRKTLDSRVIQTLIPSRVNPSSKNSAENLRDKESMAIFAVVSP